MASSPTATSCLAWDGADDKKKGEKKKSKCELIRYEALPDWLKDNEFIHGYYRCEWPMKETILSIFSIHNETLNVWSLVRPAPHDFNKQFSSFLSVR